MSTVQLWLAVSLEAVCDTNCKVGLERAANVTHQATNSVTTVSAGQAMQHIPLLCRLVGGTQVRAPAAVAASGRHGGEYCVPTRGSSGWGDESRHPFTCTKP